MRKYAKLFDEVSAMIERKKYLEKLISKKENGLVKVRFICYACKIQAGYKLYDI